MNVTVPHRTGSAPRRTTARFVKSPQSPRSGRASRTSLTLPSISAAPRHSLVSAVPNKALSRQKRRQRDAEIVLEEGVHHMSGVNAQETLESLVKVVQLRRHGSVTPRKGKPLWERVQAIVVMANQEGLRRLHMATPPEEVRFFFDNALALLEPPPKPSVEGVVDEFATQPALRKYLTGATLNNKAFLQHMAGDPPQVVIETLLRALKVQGGVFTTLTLYNLAVMMVSTRCFDKASEFIACCSKMIEECVKLAMPESHGGKPIYSLFLTNVAKHAIMCHHLVAAVASWSRLRDVEVYHSQLALCCAERFLGSQHPLTLRCSRRLTAALDDSGAVLIDESTPPRVPMLTDDLTLTEDSLTSVLLQVADTVKLPQGFVRRMTTTKGDKKRKSSSKGRKKSSLRGSQQLPNIRERRHLTRKTPSPHPPLSSSSRPRIYSPGSRRGLRGTMVPKPPPVSMAAMMESFRKERSVSPTKSEGVYSLSSGESDETPSVLTFVPKPAYYCYKHIRKEMRQLMTGLGEEMSRIAGSTVTPPELHRSQSLSLFEAAFGESRTVTPDPKEYMVIMDKKLRRLSRLIPDKHFDDLIKGILLVQSHWRGIVDRRKHQQIVLRLKEDMIRREAAERIQYAYRTHLAVRDAIEEKKKLRAHRIIVNRVILIQRYLYEKQSVEEWGLRCAEAYRRRIAENLEKRRRNAAAIRIQSCWRMCSQRIKIHRILNAVIRIQSLWRGYKGRMYAREQRVYRRLKEQERTAELTIHAKPVQIRWRKILAVRAGRAIVAERQRKILLYLEEQEAAFQKDWERIKQHPNVELCMIKVLSVLRGFRCRLECAHQYKQMNILRRFFLKLVLKNRGKHQLSLLREERMQERALRRRREEVTDAAIRIQCCVRRWLSYKQRRELWGQWQWLHHQAYVIQRAYRRYLGRRLLMEMRMEAKLKEEERLIAQLLRYAASKIQATWRMYNERQSQKDYLQFMRKDRHLFAIRIQKAWLAYKARCEVHWRERNRIERERFEQRRHQMMMAAVHIQSAARMFLTRRMLLEQGMVLKPTPAKLHRSARSIQCAWRRFAAYEYVQQLRFSRAYYDQQKVNVESLNTYATMIQALIRAKILNPPLVEMRQREIESETEEERKKRGKKLEDMYNAILAQKALRLARGLRQSPDVPARLENEDSVRAAAAITTSTTASSSIVNDADDSSETGMKGVDIEEVTELLQRCGRGLITRRALFIELCDQRLAELEMEESSSRVDILHAFQESIALLEEEIPKFTPKESKENTVDTTSIAMDADDDNISREGMKDVDMEGLAQLLQRCGRGAITRRALFMDLCDKRFAELSMEEATSRVKILYAFQESYTVLENSVPVFIPLSPDDAQGNALSTSSIVTPPAEEDNDNDNDDISNSAEMKEGDMETVVPLLQRCGRGAITRRDLFKQLRESLRWRAAVDIQRIWRGFCARQLIEVYYEFCEKEIVTEVLRIPCEEEEEEEEQS
ncbi:uncharacterized protein TM35_000241540 [Trypanosoma theileri]|uniref:IQ calmodulin-binding protein n=1 Tax=Trypanosoma theileri TaxID=67003 RepID=A0A1X0NQN4_9TRYP|nr:uncharacterized protein TM35_000241540 [Trypanosoma theileri]ORC87004.1 hypothetical protein TM35_000241540 [Trypanosoma theileri]